MVEKLDNPEFQPVYELDRSLDTVIGYDYLHAYIHLLSQNYPQDEQHRAIRLVAEESLAARRTEELQRSTGLRRTARHNLSSDNRLSRASGIDVLEVQSKAKGQEIIELELAVSGLFNGLLSEATAGEQEVIRDVIYRKKELVRQQKKAIMEKIDLKRAGLKYVRTVLSRPLPNKTAASLDNIELPKSEPFIVDPTASQFSHMCRIIEAQHNRLLPASLKPGFVTEKFLVCSLFPGLYDTDRPAAYKEFDKLYDSLKTLNTTKWSHLSSAHIQRGRQFEANAAGRATGSNHQVVFRLVWDGQEAILSSKAGVEQRVNIDDTPYVIMWDQVVPRRQTK